MASFAPQTEIQVPQDELFRSRPLQSDKSLATLFKTASDAVSGVGTHLYNAAKEDIWNQADAIVTGINESQPGFQSALDRSGNDNLRQIMSTNPTLASSYAELGKNKTALDQGVMDRSMYWAKMTIAAKELRSKYPGWNQDISDMFNSLTGVHTLEGHLNSAVEQENATKAGAADKRTSVLWQTFNRLQDDMRQNPDTYKVAQGVSNGTIPIDSDLNIQSMGATSAWRGQKDGIALKLQEINLKKAQGEQVATEASSLYAQDNSTDIQSVINSVPPFANGKSVLSFLSTMKPDDPNTIPMISQFGSWLGTQRASLAAKFNENRNKYRSLNMTDAQFQNIEDSELKPIDDLISLTGGKDPTLLAAAGQQWKATVSRQSLILSEQSPVFLRMAAAGNISPELAQWVAMNDPTLGAALTKIITGGTVDETTKTLGMDKGRSPSEAHAIAAQAIDKTVDLISRYQINGPEAINFIKKNFTVERDGFDKFYQDLHADGKQQFFETVTRPIFQEAVLKADKESPGLASTYAAWVSSKFETLPAIATIQGTIAESQGADPKNKITYGYDPMRGGITVAFPPGYQGIRFGVGRQMVQEEVSKFNVALSNMGSLYDKMGLDSKQGIYDLLSKVIKAPPTPSLIERRR